MPNCPCEDQPYIPVSPYLCDPIDGITVCLDGEQCEDIIDAGCVAYNGYPLTSINVKTGDRIDDVLITLNKNSSSLAVVVQNSHSVAFSGNGLSSTPIIATTIIDNTAGITNLLTVSAAGLKVELTTAVIHALLQSIENNASLQAMFCQLLQNCSAGSCGIPTNISASMS